VFEQQCEIIDANVRIRAKTGGACLQNPSDPDATYDGKKGPGFKVQLSESCSDDNDVQLIVAALPQTAASPDADALGEVLDDLKEKNCLPETMTADTAYGGDENVQQAAALGVDLMSPVAGPKGEDAAATASGAEALPNENGTPKSNATPAASSETGMSPPMELLSIDDFAVDERTGKVTACPTGRIPLQTIHDPEAGTTTIEMHATDCENCSFRTACPIQKKRGHYRLVYTDRQRRLAARRQEEKTDVFREEYAKRSGIESTNSGLKRRLGLGKLRVRGRKAVDHAIYLKVAGWNLLRAVASGRLRASARAQSGFTRRFWLRWRAFLMHMRSILPTFTSSEWPCIPVTQLY
jgi:hypothetical protein